MARKDHNAAKRYVIITIFLVVASVFLLRLFYIQVISDKYSFLAESNVRRIITQYPPRGVIYDRNGKKMVTNEAAYDLMIIPRQVKDLDTAELCYLLDLERSSFVTRLKKARDFSLYKPSIFLEQISQRSYGYLQEKLFRFPGFFVQPRTLRQYPYPAAAHLLGYVGEVNQKEIDKDTYYKSGDYIGKGGIEKFYEESLRGVKGEKIILVDVFNREKGSFENGRFDKPQVPGLDLTSTLDIELQVYGEALMSNKRGSIVAIEPATGEILALVSSPTYDPNLLIGRIRSKNFALLAADPLKPLFNRATQAAYPTGSTFKMINGLVGLQMGVIIPQTRFGCSGKGSSPIACSHSHASPLDLVGAIEQSCNPYFWNTFRAIIERGGEGGTNANYVKWREHVMSFGFGERFDSDLPAHSKGNIPSENYYNKIYGPKGWKSMTIRSLSIGQGELLITPLQLANQAVIIANKGFYITPHIVKKVEDHVLEFPKKITSIK
ncbi:MAG: penicillin-binding protein 2, partial [Bacteroidetes bacterium HGW-Bacteroidetes-22]